MSQRKSKISPNRQDESAVPRPPQRTISPEQVDELIGTLHVLRREFVNVQLPFPAGHPFIRTVFNHFPNVTLAELDNLFRLAGSLRTSAITNTIVPADRERLQNLGIQYDTIERRRNRFRQDLAEIRSELEDEQYNHLRRDRIGANLHNNQTEARLRRNQIEPNQCRDQTETPAAPRQQPGPSRQMAPPQPPRSMAPSPPAARRYSTQILEPFRRRPGDPTYEELLLENRTLERTNNRLREELRDAREEIEGLEDRTQALSDRAENAEWL